MKRSLSYKIIGCVVIVILARRTMARASIAESESTRWKR